MTQPTQDDGSAAASDSLKENSKAVLLLTKEMRSCCWTVMCKDNQHMRSKDTLEGNTFKTF